MRGYTIVYIVDEIVEKVYPRYDNGDFNASVKQL